MSLPATRKQRVAEWTRPAVRELKPYYKAPSEGSPLRLDQNTNLLGGNPAALRFEPRESDVTQYPTRDADHLLAALSDFHGLPQDCFVATNGGDEALDLLVKAFGEPGSTFATPTPSYGLYPFHPRMEGLRFVQVPLKGGYGTLDVEGLVAANARITIVASPNNPTGNRFPTGELERLVEASRGIVVVDEAYIEYAGLRHSLLPRVEEFDNLAVLRTFSKAYALAGLRIGYLAANADLVRHLRAVKAPFNVNTWSEHVAVAALDDQEWVDAGVKAIRQERDTMATRLKALGFRCHPTDANFILTDPPMDAGELLLALRKHGILARTFPHDPAVQRSIRFTVGSPAHTDQLVTALRDILGRAS